MLPFARSLEFALATPFDITFFKLAISKAVTDRATAERCLQYIDKKASKGQTLAASDVMCEMGLMDPQVAAKLVAMTQELLGAESPASVPGAGGFEESVSTLRASPLRAMQEAAPIKLPSAERRVSDRQAQSPERQTQSSGRQAQSSGRSRRKSGRSSRRSAEMDGLEIGDKIARGPVGFLYSGTDLRSSEKIALKIISRKFASHREIYEQILADIRKAVDAKLDHPHIVRPRQLAEREGRNLVAYDFVEGQDLAEIIEEYGALPPSRAIDIVVQIAKALQFAHGKGIVHGDVRPKKVFANVATAEVRVADFGLFGASALGQGFAKDGVAFGHPQYLAPEVVQMSLRRPTPLQDIYALGILTYELVCGAAPFSADSTRETLMLHLQEPIPPPPEDVFLHSRLAETIMELTAKDPERRTRTMGEAVRRLEELSGIDLDYEDEDSYASAENHLSSDQWNLNSGEYSKHAEEWNEEKISGAINLEPEEWNPDSIEDDPELEDLATTARSKKESARRPKTGGAKAVKDYHSALTNAAGGIKSQSKKGPPLGDAGQRMSLRGNDVRRDQESLQRKLSVAAVVGILLFLGIGFAMLRSPEERKKATLNLPEKRDEPAPKRKQPKPNLKKLRRAHRKRVDKALGKLRGEAERLIAAKRWPEAIAAWSAIPSELRNEGEITAEVQAIEKKVKERAQQEMRRSQSVLSSMLKRGTLASARKLLGTLEKRSLPATRPGLLAMEAGLLRAEQLAAKAAEAAKRDAAQPAWIKDLIALLGGEASVKNGVLDVTLRWSDPKQVKFFDHNAKNLDISKDKPPVLGLRAAEGGSLLVLNLPLQILERLEIEYRLDTVLKKGSDFAAAIGISAFAPRRMTLVSVDGTTRRVKGKKRKRVQRGRRTKVSPWDDKKHRLVLEVVGSRVEARIDGEKTMKYVADDFDGFVGIWIAKFTVQILSLRLRGTVDEPAVIDWCKRRKKG